MNNDSGTLKELFYGTSLVTIGGIIRDAIRFITIVLLGILLTPSGYGIYVLAFTIPGIVFNFALNGLIEGIVRSVSVYFAKAEYYQLRNVIIKILGIHFVVGACISITLYFSSGFISESILLKPEITEPLRLASFAVLLLSLFGGVINVFRALQRINHYVALHLIQVVTYLAVVAVFLNSGFGVMGAIQARILTGSATLLTALILCIKVYKDILATAKIDASSTTSDSLKDVVLFSSQINILNGLKLSRAELITTFLGRFSSTAEVAYFSIANSVMQIIGYSGSGSLAIMLFPEFSKLHAKNDQTMIRRLFRITLKVSLVLVAFVGGFIIIGSRPFLTEFVPSYLPAYPVIVLIVIVAIVNSISGSLGSILRGLDKLNISIKYGSIAAVVSLILNLFFSYMGIYNAVIGGLIYVVIMVIWNIPPLFEVSRLLGLSIPVDFVLKLSFAFSLSIFIPYISTRLLGNVYLQMILVALFVALFGVFCIVLGAFKKEELDYLIINLSKNELTKKLIPILQLFKRLAR
ncbi:MAG: oligosaccharide flippase family protein [Promethearchaeota archaeon]